MRLRRPETHALTGAYAMHALTGADAARFERHLARCPACTAEVSEFAEATARLAAAAAAQPPAAVKQRALAAAARTRQLPLATARAVASRPARTVAWPALPRSLLRRPWAARLALAAAAAAVALAAVLGVTARIAQHQLAASQASSHQIAAVLTAPDATMIDARVRTGGTVTVVMSRLDRALVFAAAGLRPLPSSRCYQLWLLRPGTEQPAAMLPDPQHGRTGPVTVTGLAPASRLGLSIEPAGGSRHPTTAMILVLAL
jgi:anti-sigma factor RsiW